MRRAISPTGDRIYAAVKGHLLSGDILPGERLDAAMLAHHYAASITPVRAALHRLVGEGLVLAEAGEGFHTPRLTEANLRDLYAWNGHLLLLAWQLANARGGESAELRRRLAPVAGDAGVIANTEHLFSALGDLSDNEQCLTAVDAMNDKLRLSRRLETRLFADIAEEWISMAEAVATLRSNDIRHSITSYHRRRVRVTPDLLRLIYRPDPLL